MKTIKIIFSIVIALLTLTLSPLLQSASASHNEAQMYEYLLGTSFLCDLDPSACPVKTMADNGDIIELTGQGTINTDTGEATGGGTFIHKDKDGNVLGSGDWHAMELISFKSWGQDPSFPPDFEGGRAKLRVHLAPDGGGEFFAKLRIICTIGKFPPSYHEGVQLKIKHGPNFDEQVSGLTLFVRK